MAGDHYDLCAGSPDLSRFLASVINTLLVIAGGQGAAASTAAELVLIVWLHIDPILKALIQYPAGFLIVAVTEEFFRFATVITGRVVGDPFRETGFIQTNTLFPDVFHQQVENSVSAALIENLRIPRFETKPGRDIGVTSLAPE